MSGDEPTTPGVGVGRRALASGWTRERYVLLAVVAMVLLSFGPSFQVYLLTEFLVVALFAVGFNLLYGYTGLLSFGHAMFYAAGAYGLAIVLRDFQPVVVEAVGSGVAPLATYLAGAAAGVLLVVIVAIPIGWLSVRLEEIYFALITLAFGMLAYSVIQQDPRGLTNGTDGVLVLLGTIDVGGFEARIGERRTYYYLTLSVVLTSIYTVHRIVQSPFGTVCRSIRESPDRATALGVDVDRHRWTAFVLSALFVGVAGVLNAGLANVASPSHSHWTTSAIPVAATVIGGAAYFAGPIVGAFVYLYVRWIISRFPALEAHWQFFFGAMLVLVVLYFKQGAAGGLVLLHGWLLELRAEYRRGGPGGAAAYARSSAVEWLRRGGGRLRRLGGRVAAPVRRVLGRDADRGGTER